MKSLRNTVQLIGNLGTDPEVKTLDNGNSLAKISIATTERYTNQKGEKIQDTTWHNCVAWGKTAEFAENFLKKGSEVCLEGKLSNRSYDDKEGVKKYISEVVINQILMTGSKS